MRTLGLLLLVMVLGTTAYGTTTTTTPSSSAPPTTLFPRRCAALMIGAGGRQCGSPEGFDPIVPTPCPAGTICRPWDNYVCRCVAE